MQHDLQLLFPERQHGEDPSLSELQESETPAPDVGLRKDLAGEDLSGFDESKMEKAMEMLAREAGGIDENDPRQAAQLMRRLTDATGLSLGPKMEEALARMESGEDPEKIEAEMGDSIGEDELFIMAKKAASGKKDKKPRVDERLYDL
jgi:hypothetical protein